MQFIKNKHVSLIVLIYSREQSKQLICYDYNNITSIAHHMSNTLSKKLVTIYAQKFLFSCIIQCFAEFQNRRQFRTQSHSHI